MFFAAESRFPIYISGNENKIRWCTLYDFTKGFYFNFSFNFLMQPREARNQPTEPDPARPFWVRVSKNRSGPFGVAFKMTIRVVLGRVGFSNS